MGRSIAPKRRMPEREVSPDSGFLLIDAIIATAILAGAVLACAALIAHSMALNAMARQTTRSVVLAAQRLEELRSRQTLAPGETGREDLDETGTVLQPGDVGRRAYVRQWTIVSMSRANLARVVVAVTPAGGGSGGVVLTSMRRIALP
jgi:Tfp pilus assembly protein PilV